MHGRIDEELVQGKQAPSKEEMDEWYLTVGPHLMGGYGTIVFLPDRPTCWTTYLGPTPLSHLISKEQSNDHHKDPTR